MARPSRLRAERRKGFLQGLKPIDEHELYVGASSAPKEGLLGG